MPNPGRPHILEAEKGTDVDKSTFAEAIKSKDDTYFLRDRGCK